MYDLNKLEEVMERHGCILEQVAPDYSEQGYEKEHPDNPIITANWNKIPKRLINWIDKHYDTEWGDEWCVCNECGNLVRTQPDCYGWTSYYHIFNECELVCGECIKEDPETYIQTLINNPNNCESIGLDLESMGFKNLNGIFEAGLYGRPSDKPDDILSAYMEQFPDKDIIFGSLSTSQFNVEWEIYGRDKQPE